MRFVLASPDAVLVPDTFLALDSDSHFVVPQIVLDCCPVHLHSRVRGHGRNCTILDLEVAVVGTGFVEVELGTVVVEGMYDWKPEEKAQIGAAGFGLSWPSAVLARGVVAAVSPCY